MKSSYHWVWQLILNIVWAEKYPDLTENKTFTGPDCCGQAAVAIAVAHFFQMQTSQQRYPKKEALYFGLFPLRQCTRCNKYSNQLPNPVIAGFHPIYDLKLPLVDSVAWGYS